VAGLAFAVVAIYGLGMTVVILFANDETLALRMLNIFPGVFGSALALCTGYLIGSSSSNTTHCDCPACTVARLKLTERASQDDN
jgi:hypothetical protein